jgi:hypothetical protein
VIVLVSDHADGTQLMRLVGFLAVFTYILIVVFTVMSLCSLAGRYQHFRGIYSLYIQGRSKEVWEVSGFIDVEGREMSHIHF